MTTPDTEDAVDRLRILHWNIHSWRDVGGGSNVRAIRDLVAETEPHVVSLVEVNEPWGMAESLPALADGLGYSWLFIPSFEFGDNAPAGGFGNALLSRQPILAVQQWHLRWPTRPYDGTEPSEPRSVIVAKFGLARRALWIGGTHLPSRDAQERSNALQRLVTLTGKLDEPWLVCGDFNTPAATWTGGTRSFMVRPASEAPTFPTKQPTQAIDYCISSPDLRVEAKVLSVGGSDHLPVMASVEAGH